MSVLAEFVRLDVEHLEYMRRLAALDAYKQLIYFDPNCRLDLDQQWSKLAPLMDAAAFPINPITDGSPFPDERRAWTDGPIARWLNVQEVALAAAHLSRISYDLIVPHIRAVLKNEDGIYVDLDPESPEYMKPLSSEEVSRITVSEERVRAVTEVLAEPYRGLVNFFGAAADHGQCAIFWAA